MNALPITAPQLKRLQVLYSQFERHTLDAPGPERTSRLQWATQATGRTVSSFKDLTLVEAKRLIEQLQGTLGVKAPNKSPRQQSRKHGQKLGTEGRHDQIHNETTMAGEKEFALIQRDLDRLGWNEDRLKSFLRSTRNPIRSGRTEIRTLGDANNVHWALKNITPDHERIAS